MKKNLIILCLASSSLLIATMHTKRIYLEYKGDAGHMMGLEIDHHNDVTNPHHFNSVLHSSNKKLSFKISFSDVAIPTDRMPTYEVKYKYCTACWYSNKKLVCSGDCLKHGTFTVYFDGHWKFTDVPKELKIWYHQ